MYAFLELQKSRDKRIIITQGCPEIDKRCITVVDPPWHRKWKDVRTENVALGLAGKDINYFLDFGVSATDVAALDEITGGVMTRRTYLFDDLAELVCPLDALIIDGHPGGPVYV